MRGSIARNNQETVDPGLKARSTRSVSRMTGTNHRDVLVDTTDRTEPDTVEAPANDRDLAQSAQAWAQKLVWLPATKQSAHFAQRLTALNRRLNPCLPNLMSPPIPTRSFPKICGGCTTTCGWCEWRRARSRVRLRVASRPSCAHSGGRRSAASVGHRRRLARRNRVSLFGHAFTTYMETFQTVTGLNMSELSLLIPCLKLLALEEFTARAEKVLRRRTSRNG